MPVTKRLDGQIRGGNVFPDLGLVDVEEHLVMANLVLKIGEIIGERGLIQTVGAMLAGYSAVTLWSSSCGF